MKLSYKVSLLIGLVVLAMPQITLAQVPVIDDGAHTMWSAVTQYAGVIPVWRVVLSLVDIVVVVGLLVAAFANIFNFLPIKLDNYQVKQILPGLIIGIVLANLSYFIMQLLFESSSIISQMIGVILEPRLGGDLGDSYANVYITRMLTNELLGSLFSLPTDWRSWGGAAVVGAGPVAAAVAFASFASILTGLGVFLAVVLLIGLLGPLIILVLIYLLLYIRVFVLIALFMIAPAAFFSLGFPPLKGFWQKWWNTLWRWLMMGPLVYLVLGLATLFLYTTNVADGYRSVMSYLLINGIAMGLLYLALRIPFMWGDLKIFGLGNAMEKWQKYGTKGAKAVIDPAAKSLAGAKSAIGARDDAREAALKARADARARGASREEVVSAGRDAARNARHKAFRKGYKDGSGWNPIRQIEGAQRGFKERLELMGKNDDKAIKGTAAWRYAAGPEKTVRQTQEDNKDLINSMDDPEDVSKQLLDITNKARGGAIDPTRFKKLFLQQSPSKLADNEDLNQLGISQEDRAKAQLLMTRLQYLYQRNNKAGVWDESGPLPLSFVGDPSTRTYKFDEDVYERLRPRRGGGGPYGDLDASDPYADAFVDGAPAPDTRQYAQDNGREFVSGVQQRHRQSRVALEQAARAAQIPSDHLGPIVELIHEAADQGNALTPADLTALGIDTAHHAALMPAITQYQHTYGKLNQAVQMSVPEDLQRAEQFAIHILPNLQLDRPGFENRIREVRGQLDDYLRELGDNAISQDRLNHIRTEMGKINPALIPADADRSGLREALLKNATNTKKALSILSDETMKQALEGGVQGQDINAVLRQSVNVRAVKDKVTYDTANIVEQLKKQQVPLEEIQTNQEVIQKVSAGVQTLVEIHPEFKQTVGTLEPAAQQTVIEQSVSGLVGEMLKHAPQGTSAHDAVRTFEQREQFAQEIYGQLKRHYEAAHTQQAAAATPPAPQSPQAEVASTEPAAATAPSAPVAPPPVESTPGQIEDIVAPAPADIPAAPSEPESPPEA